MIQKTLFLFLAILLVLICCKSEKEKIDIVDNEYLNGYWIEQNNSNKFVHFYSTLKGRIGTFANKSILCDTFYFKLDNNNIEIDYTDNISESATYSVEIINDTLFELTDINDKTVEAKAYKRLYLDSIFIVDTIELKLKEFYEGKYMFLEFDTVLSDSRCPKEAMICLSSDNASIQLYYTDLKRIDRFILNTNNDFKTFQYINGVYIYLLDLYPEPLLNEKISLNDYIVKLAVLK